jgi:protein arginine N-methyltransferase 1
MKCIKKWVLSEPLVDPIDSQDILSDSYKYYSIDLKTVKKQELDYLRDFKLEIVYEGKVHGFVTWFDCEFSKGEKKITLSTSPYKKSTHWKQTIFYL